MPQTSTMSKKAEFFFDVGSPAAYLAWTQLPALRTTGARIDCSPMLLGGGSTPTSTQCSVPPGSSKPT
jgi:2-hydroxychromene-2-carboxylate isomerase